MKTKISKILGIVLAVATVASLFMLAVPASAATQAWSAYTIPSTTGMVLNTTITAGGPIAEAIDGTTTTAGTLYAYVLDGSTNKIIKSTNAGRTWVVSGTVGQPTTSVVEIVCSPTEANVVFYATATNLYMSSDSGATFSIVVSVPTTDSFTALDVAKWGSPSRYIAVVGVNSLLPNATMLAGVYYWDQSLPFNNLTPVGSTTFNIPGTPLNVLSVRMAPTFATDRAVIAFGTGYATYSIGTLAVANGSASVVGTNTAFTAAMVGGTITISGVAYTISAVADATHITLSIVYAGSTDPAALYTVAYGNHSGTVRMDVNGGAWGALVADFNVATTAGAFTTAADIATPSDFNAVTSPIYFICLADADAADGGIYRVIGNVPTRIDTGLTWTNMSINGAFGPANANIMVGSSNGLVKKSSNSGFSFSSVTLRSAYTSATAWVLLDRNYTTSKLAWVMNVGGAQSAFNVSTDSLSSINQWSLINDSINATNGIRDLAVAPNGDMFMITTSNGTANSLWRNLVSASTPWERVYWNTGDTMDHLRLGVGSSTTLFYWVTNSAAALNYSTNSANSFSAMTTAPGTIVGAANNVYSLYVVSSTQVVVGDNTGTIVTNLTSTGVVSAYWWNEVTNAPFGTSYTVTSIVSAGGTNLLAAAINGTSVEVATSANNGLTWTLLTVPGVTPAATSVLTVTGGTPLVAPAADYATTGNIFVAANSGVWRFSTLATSIPATYTLTNGWLKVDAAGTGVTTAAGLVTAPGGPGSTTEGSGMVYATDSNAANGRVARIKGLEATGETLDSTTTSAPSVYFTTLQASPSVLGGVQLWTISSDSKIYTYTDTLGIAGTGVAISPISTTAATVTFNNMTNATAYVVKVNPVKQTSIYSAANGTGITVSTVTIGATTSTCNVTGLTAGTTYYVSVWATNGVTATSDSSFIYMGASGPTTFTTLMAIPLPPTNLVPYLGENDVNVLPQFAWGRTYSSDTTLAPAATSYTLQIALSTGTFSSPLYNNAAVPALSGPTITFNYTGTPLLNNTSYMWRVMANGATSNSDWVYGNFTTIAAVVPPVTVTNAPAISITLTQAAANPVPTIILTQGPNVTVTQAAPVPTPIFTLPQQTIVIAQPVATTPTYIWIIVGVGGLLTLAVIILIIRTRRVV